ncbi:MAG: response regulator [Pirellulaceae bacterium]|nr:response regulator [Pirellulaceae bacterium]
MSTAHSTGEGYDVLLVEDSRGDALLVNRAFEEGQAGTRLHVAVDGEAALAFLRQEGPHTAAPRPDLILLDLNLPGMDGREVLATIKADASLRRIPVVVLTSSQSEDDVRNCYNLHANAYMPKTSSFDGLISLTRAIRGYWLSAVKLPPK